MLAAQSFTRLVESFPDDTLADDAALEAARSYRRLWRKPALDATYGETRARGVQHADRPVSRRSPLTARRPSRRWPSSRRGSRRRTTSPGCTTSGGRRTTPAIIYFKDVVAEYPDARPRAAAQLRLVESYKAIRYRDDAAEACAELRTAAIPDDAEVRHVRDVAAVAGRRDSQRPTRPRRRAVAAVPPAAEACASASSAAASIRRTSDICSPCTTRAKRSGSIAVLRSGGDPAAQGRTRTAASARTGWR